VPILAIALLAGSAGAQTRPRLEVGLREHAGGPPDAVVTLHDLLADDRFLSAMRSGFPLYMAYQLELRESRSMWDRVVAREAWELVVLYDPGRDLYRLEDHQGTEEIRDRGTLERRLSAAYVFEGLRTDGPGRFHFRATVAARTLSDEDVDEVFAWLRGDAADTPRRPGLVTRTARKLLIQVAPLPRLTLDARSADFSGR
jgi:hypothetical protein